MFTKARFKTLALGVKVKELARRIDVSESYLTNILNGRVRPSQEVLRRIAEALGLEPDEVQEEVKGEE
ncbi:helix-turn-helix domain-containing protein [Candidatus Caldatribacterium saccharofermentans]|uniref:helix-turn-helix domain-containing protein n=1 Tax=Candidatus Caldatribacterium saccharofermentans TaxID=1454753 RepID=UPI003D036CF0